MGNQTLVEKIKEFIAKYSFKIFLWSSELDEEEYWEQITRDIDLNRWQNAKEMIPDYDGDYLCKVEQVQECGAIWKKCRVVTNSFGVWQLLNGESVTYWMENINAPEE